MKNVTQRKYIKVGYEVTGMTYLCYRTRGDPSLNDARRPKMLHDYDEF